MNLVQLLEELKRDEGCVSHAYVDSEGFLTIGIGRMVDQRLGGGVTEEEAIYLLENDIGKTIKWLREKYPWFEKLNDDRQRAIVNMGFNLGERRFAGFRRMIKALEIGHYERAALESLDSKWARQVGDRAIRIADMIRGRKAHA